MSHELYAAPYEEANDVLLAWYASFGSNMDIDRFDTYIRGGVPRGGSRNYAGCADKTPPRASRPIHLPFPLYFAGQSSVWRNPEDEGKAEYESGAAFIGLTTSPDSTEHTKGRAHLITLRQLEDVTAQEGWVDAIAPIDIDKLRKLGHMPVGSQSKNYDRFVYCGEFDGYPVISFTSSVELRPHTKPARPYLGMLSSGLIAGHNMTAEAVAEYLSDKPGILGRYAMSELVEIAHLFDNNTAQSA